MILEGVEALYGVTAKVLGRVSWELHHGSCQLAERRDLKRASCYIPTSNLSLGSSVIVDEIVCELKSSH